MTKAVYGCLSCGLSDIAEDELKVMFAHERHNQSPEECGEGAFELLKTCPSGKHVLEREED